ncbi:MAG TPA: transketolase [Cyanobacteria bacterium UBA10660]|nr:MAG TPA: transketolase [Candidatus Gastranaerophilales bacterium HUM_1]HAS94094.1 transketolase [Cyanobacteria bacterium UBA10660]
MKIDKTKTNSIRKAFGKTLAEIGELNEKIIVMDADLACSTQTKIFADKFPDRFFDCGIAEQNMLATAAGLASEGKIPFVASFAVFVTGRTYDQIRNGICYPNFNVKIVGTHGGVTVGEDGATHQALEDISLMRGLPHMTVIVPADCKECKEAIKYAALHEGPTYIRIPRSNVPDIFDENYSFNIHKAVVVEEGTDVSVFTNGETLAEVLLAAEELKKDNISLEVINVPVVKPLDFQTVIESVKKTKLAITVENHSIIGGLGSAICETLADKLPSKVYRFGINDEFGQSGKAEELIEYYGLDSKTLAKRIRAIIKKEKEQGNI